MRRVLTDAFKMHGHEVVIARNGQEALRNLAVGAGLDVLVIDIGLPDADGRDVCQALRAAGQHAPVLFLTALDAVHDRVSGFHAGGDDYVPKPFAISEVMVRVRRCTSGPGRRRSGVSRAAPQPGPVRGAHGEREVKLTPTEFRLLASIAAEPGTDRAATGGGRRRMARRGHGQREHASTRFIRRLRVKLEAVGSPVALETVRGVGFVLR